jgi:hypothetical protein
LRRKSEAFYGESGENMAHTEDLTSAMRECIRNCQECHAICTETAAHCLQMGGKHAAAEHIRQLLDCADICGTSANFMLRASPEHVRTCAVCAELCRACADSCEKLESSDPTLRKCVEFCRRCVQSCEQMAAAKA